MEQIPTNLIKTAAIKGGTAKLSSTSNPAVKKQADQEQTVSTQQTSKVLKENGVTTSTTAEGFRAQTSDTGVSVVTTDKGQEVTLPTGHSFQLTDEGLRPLNEESSQGASLIKTDENLLLISFQDKDGNTVQVQPDSLTYEVLNKQKNLSQVFHPDGHQEVVAFGKFRDPESGQISEYEHHVVYDPSGQVVANQGFQDVAVEGRKLSFDLGNGVRTERTLARPLPGQPPFEEAPASKETPVSSAALNPLSIFGEQPVVGGLELGSATGLGATSVLNTVADVSAGSAASTLLQGATVSTPVTSEQVRTQEAPVGEKPGDPAEAQALAEFQSLPNIHKDFFAGADKEGVAFDQTTSGLVMRQEGNSRAFLLPNGDAFRTDGKHLEIIGESPRAKNARIVVEGEAQLLAYSDPDGNNHRLDINSGDYEVSNRQGTLTQGVKADGTREYSARGTYTTEAGKPMQYFHKATFGAGGALLSKEGFDDLRISGNSMAFTLTNGVETDRKLIQDAGHEVSIPKKLVVTGGFADEWGAGLALADQLLDPTSAVSSSAPVHAAQVPNQNPPVQGPRAPGVVRMPLPDGGAVSTLPNGIRINDSSEGLTALDPMGNPMQVQKSVLASDTGESYLMTVHTPDGVGYTIANNNLDMIVQSADGKVHQLVGPTGKVLTSIMDNGNQHLVEKDPFNGVTGSPGTRIDPRFPDRVFVDGPGGTYHYQVPHPLAQPTPVPPGQTNPGAGQVPPDGQEFGGMDPDWNERSYSNNGHLAGPGGTAEGFRPSFWQRLKGAFTGENPWDAQSRMQTGFDQRQMHGNRFSGGYPSRQYEFDPQAAQWAQFNQQYQMNSWMLAMQQMQTMSMMFFTPMGWW